MRSKSIDCRSFFFNLISGMFITDIRSVTFDGVDITLENSTKRARSGIGRTFQVVKPFTGMAVAENVMVPLLVKHPSVSAAERGALELRKELAIANIADIPSEALTLAQRKRVEVARALAIELKLRLLDEVLAGLNSREVVDVLPFVTRVRDRGVSILMIEHIVSTVMEVSDRMMALDHGQQIALGDPKMVIKDPEVPRPTSHLRLGVERCLK